MPKKTKVTYMMLSGWLPVSYSHYRSFECQWVGSIALNTDEFYGSLKIIADDLNDKLSKKIINRNILNYLKGTNMSKLSKNNFFEEAYTFVYEYMTIEKYYKEFFKDLYTEIDFEKEFGESWF